MADQVTIPGTAPVVPPVTPAVAPPPAGDPPPPAAVVPPAVVPPPAVTPPPATPPAAAPEAKKVFRIPQAKLEARVGREAEKRIQKELGCTLEEAKELLAKSKAKGGGAPEGETEAERIARLEKKAERERERGDKWKSRLQRTRASHGAEVFELNLRHAALVSGVLDDHVDFALDRYQKHVQADGADKAQEPRAFFAGLRGKYPYLFGSSAAPVAPEVVKVPASTAAPESTAPGGGPPETAAKPVEKPINVDDMSPEEFRRYTRRNHNYGG